jgi:hypothetical protein
MMNELQARFFAFNAYYHTFYNKEDTFATVLRGIKSAEQIYSDEIFGLDSVAKLYYWMQMIIEDTKRETTLKDYVTSYFTAKGVQLSPANMEQIMGKRSILK